MYVMDTLCSTKFLFFVSQNVISGTTRGEFGTKKTATLDDILLICPTQNAYASHLK